MTKEELFKKILSGELSFNIDSTPNNTLLDALREMEFHNLIKRLPDEGQYIVYEGTYDFKFTLTGPLVSGNKEYVVKNGYLVTKDKKGTIFAVFKTREQMNIFMLRMEAMEMPRKIAEELASVQPMSIGAGSLFGIRTKYKDEE